MPYKDPDKAREAKRESARRRRAALGGERRLRLPTVDPSRSVDPNKPVDPTQVPPVPSDIRLGRAQDVLRLLEQQTSEVRDDPAAWRLSQARVIALLSGVALRTIEAGSVQQQIEELKEWIRNGTDKTGSAEEGDDEIRLAGAGEFGGGSTPEENESTPGEAGLPGVEPA